MFIAGILVGTLAFSLNATELALPALLATAAFALVGFLDDFLMTGGKYFRATDNDKLQQIYSEIDQLEKSKIEVKHFSKKNEQYFIFGLLGMCLLIAQAVLKYTLLRKIP